MRSFTYYGEFDRIRFEAEIAQLDFTRYAVHIYRLNQQGVRDGVSIRLEHPLPSYTDAVAAARMAATGLRDGTDI